MSNTEIPPVVSIVGKKNSGKTTLLVAVARQLKTRGFRIASVKHGHHGFEIDQPGRDTWRHLHEGETEAVLMVGGSRIALIMELEGEEPDPDVLIRRYFAGAGYDLVLVEGYKQGPFPKVEIFRLEHHRHPVYNPADSAAASRFLAIVSDDMALEADCPVIPIDPADPLHGSHVEAVTTLIERRVLAGESASR